MRNRAPGESNRNSESETSENDCSLDSSLLSKAIKKKGSSHESAFEALLLKVKPDGPYQWKLILLLMLPLSFTYAIAERGGVILMSTQDHVCHVPGREHTKFTIEEWHNITVPWSVTSKGEIKQEQCLRYQRISKSNSTATGTAATGTTATGTTATGTAATFDKNKIVYCDHGWDYDNSSWTETPVSKFDFVCKQSNRVKYIFLIGLIGSTIGALFFSVIADKFGRKPTFFMVLVMNIIFGTAQSFSTSFETMGVLIFMTTTTFLLMHQAPYIIVQEVCNQKLRYYTTLYSLCIFALASAYDSFMAWLLGDWKLFIYVTYLPSAIFLLYWKFVPESPRWLLSQGKFKECEKVMMKIAETNGETFTEEMRKLLMEAQEEELKKKIPIIKVFSSRVLTKHLFLCSVILSCSYVIAGGINLNVHMMLGNVLVNYFILRSFELPGNVIGFFSAAYLGRKFTVFFTMILATLCVILASFYVSEQWSLIVLCGLTKSFCKATIYTITLYLGELFPTSLRSTAYGIAHVVAISAIIYDPSIIFLGNTNPKLPYFIWFGVGLLAIVFSLFLPETMDQPLPQTIQDAMNIGKNQSYCSFAKKRNINKYKSSKFKKDIRIL